MAGDFNPVERDLNRLWELTGERRHADALAAASVLAIQLSEHRDWLYLQALNLRCLNRVPEALAALERLERVHPRCSRLFQERGECYVALRDVNPAIDAFVRGVRLNPARVYRRSGRPFFIDKMPNNFWHIGLIHLMLPNAKLIDARREPMGCCFGNFKQLFGTSRQEFSYSIEDIARYYRSYLEVMQHWSKVLPGRVLTIQHEDLVEDLEGSVRRILDYCGLPFEPACLGFHKTSRSVRSASSEQVRQPISREGLHQWRHYEPWLGPLKEALGNAVVTYKLV